MKKCMLIVLISAFTLSSLGALCYAQTARTMANTSKKGSLLIFPLIKVGQKDSQDTIITISNDFVGNPYGYVRLQCVWKTPKGCACSKFDFRLTDNQPISFSAKTGKGIDNNPVTSKKPIVQVQAFPNDGSNVGELKCWAINGTTKNPISFNWLSGDAIIGEDDNESWEYSAWRFAVGYGVANLATVPNSIVNNVGTLRLTGLPTTYDACPQKTIYNFVEQAPNPAAATYPESTDTPGGFRTVDNRVTLIPCKQDCLTRTNTVVRASLDVHNEYETSSGTYACLDCNSTSTAFFSKSLAGTDLRTSQIDNPSVFINLQSPGGMITVDDRFAGTQGDVDCQRSIEKGGVLAIPMIGVSSMRFSSSKGPVAGETPTILGPPQPYIMDGSWTPVGEVTIEYAP